MTNSKSRRRKLSSAETNHLWMISAGICSFEGCTKRLVKNSNGNLTNIGIIAHIIGHSEGGPRHEFAEEFGFSESDLENVDNLMLMCYEHSKLIDDKHTMDEFPPAKLFDMKKKHENWVRSRIDCKKKSLAIVHKRLGPPISTLALEEHSPLIMLEVIENQTEFIDFTHKGWEKGKADNERLFKKFIEMIKEGNYDAGEVYPLSPIPLLIHFGKLLSDTTPLTIYQYDRDNGVWVYKKPVGMKLEPLNPFVSFTDRGSSELIVTVSISDVVMDEDIRLILGEKRDQFNIVVDNPNTKRLLYYEHTKQIQKLFKQKVEALIRRKKYSRIHLLYCGPAGLAIEIGRSINQNMWPEVALYEFKYRQTPRHSLALII